VCWGVRGAAGGAPATTSRGSTTARAEREIFMGRQPSLDGLLYAPDAAAAATGPIEIVSKKGAG
ncbi:hypothetical protein, partial [Burkholderia contaminans]|uniref:hypothetical protein n=1 Tax=Burkholderia contaminans TaxID=488447 RepID=UPI001C936F9A